MIFFHTFYQTIGVVGHWNPKWKTRNTSTRPWKSVFWVFDIFPWNPPTPIPSNAVVQLTENSVVRKAFQNTHQGSKDGSFSLFSTTAVWEIKSGRCSWGSLTPQWFESGEKDEGVRAWIDDRRARKIRNQSAHRLAERYCNAQKVLRYCPGTFTHNDWNVLSTLCCLQSWMLNLTIQF